MKTKTISIAERGDAFFHEPPKDVSYDWNETPFGAILRGEAPAITLHETDDLLAFEHIRPRARLHALVIPKQHIRSVCNLTRDHLSLLKDMKEMAMELVKELQPEAYQKEDFRMCFHVPPFTTVDHLSLHVLAPASKTNFFYQIGTNNPKHKKHATALDDVIQRFEANACFEKTPTGVSHDQNMTTFGKIIRGEAPAVVLHETDDLLVFEDRKPRAPLHALVVPKERIPSVLDVKKEHLPLLEEMKEVALELVKEIQPTAYEKKNFTMCFHSPPNTSVNHLTLHVLAPHHIGQDSPVYDNAASLDDVIGELKMGQEFAPPSSLPKNTFRPREKLRKMKSNPMLLRKKISKYLSSKSKSSI